MDSLYGGKPGSPFVIKQSFPSVNEMSKEFAKGAGYNKVWYGEYCIIDSVNKNSKENGRIYRRGYTGHEYIGQIVGPKGGDGNFAIGSINDVAKFVGSDLFASQGADAANTQNYRNYPTADATGKIKNNWVQVSENANANDIIDKGYPLNGSSNYFKSQKYNDPELIDSDVAIQEFNSSNGSLVPGKNSDGTYNDSIRWNYCNVRVLNKDNKDVPDELDTWMYIGFEFPYSVFEMSATKVEHYKPVNIEELDESKPHPYYWKYNIDIPAGRPGQDLVSIYVEDYDSTNPTHQQAVNGLINPPAEGKPIWLYQVRNYENENENTEPAISTLFASEYIGEYVIEYSPDNYTITNATTADECREWLKNNYNGTPQQNQVVTCATSNGIFAFVYDNGEWKEAGAVSITTTQKEIIPKTYTDIFFTRQ